MEQQTNILKTVFSVSKVFSQTVSDDIGNSNFYDLCVCTMREKKNNWKNNNPQTLISFKTFKMTTVQIPRQSPA